MGIRPAVKLHVNVHKRPIRLQPTRLETDSKQASEYCISIRPIGKVVNGRDPDGKALYTGSCIASDFAVLVLSEAVLSEAVIVLVIEYT
jgi:hypothetical protein